MTARMHLAAYVQGVVANTLFVTGAALVVDGGYTAR